MVEIQRSIGPEEQTDAHRRLEKEMGFNYHSVLGELVYAYVMGQLDIGYAVTQLAKYSQHPD